MTLRIQTTTTDRYTVWQVVDDDDNVIAWFNSLGGYTLADAEKVVNEFNAKERTNQSA